ncbi:hypothetical protein GCM10007216_28810 [Thalassobacillus devorans]|uniref:DUF1641 domain-containing protein n=1 Tax=Thalassobacillus devorans TaxID=279813 RepID=A0ABQ1PFF9_9BACI|nr:DUF1641 domain-containing protein [Thalassobacillus devorans]NIK29386.1 uncharacterized protein YjgD (DUF1641 family) [Thalassobacillus devorans]GGC96277.1 hypothetical protein GCM10007216_28810 [Thalassobacillus devorans]
MAKAIRQIEMQQSTAEEMQQKDMERILSQIADNKQAITSMLEIVDQLEATGVLDILKGFLSAREKIGTIAVEQINQPNIHHTIKNIFYTMGFVGHLEPEKLRTMLESFQKGVETASTHAEEKEKTSTWGLVKSLRDPHVVLALSTMVSFLKGMGNELEEKGDSQ